MTAQQRTILVALMVMSCCLLGSQAAHVAVSQTICSDNSGTTACQSGSSHSSHTGPNGVTVGECTYANQQGQYVKVKYEVRPDGTVNAETENPQLDAGQELQRCREANEVGQIEAQQNFEQIQADHQRLQEQIQRQQQQLQQQILQHQRAIFNPGNFQFPDFNPIQFPNLNQERLLPQF